MTDNVNHPAHYNVGGIEVIDIIEAFTKDLDSMNAYETGNIIKYILRWPHKNGLEDLKKARWYLNHMIARLEAVDACNTEKIVPNALSEIGTNPQVVTAHDITLCEDKASKAKAMRKIVEDKLEDMYGKKD